MFWRAKIGDKYFFVDFNTMHLTECLENNRYEDNVRYSNGNYFKTKKECNEYVQIIKLLLSYEQRFDKNKSFKKMIEIVIKLTIFY